MSRRILIVQPIMPRLPIGLISLRLSLNDGGARKEFSYTPLALFFHRARAHTIESTHSTNYVGRDGVNITIAPRFEFSIQLASSLRALTDHHRFLAQQNRHESDETLSIPYPFVAKNYLELAKVTDQKRRGEVDRTLLISSSVARHYLTLATRENQISRRVISTVFKTQNADEVSTPQQWMNSSAVLKPKPSLRRDLDEIDMLPISVFRNRGQFLAEKIGLEWKFSRRNRIFEVGSTVNRSTLTLNHQFLTSAVCKVTRCLKNVFSQRHTGIRNQVYSRDGSHSHGLFTSNASVSDYSTETWDPRFPGRQVVQQRQSSAAHERLISPAQVSYRAEKKQRPSSVATNVEPTSLPINPPKINIDRLSNDVWNKIEKRIRIERERHGRL